MKLVGVVDQKLSNQTIFLFIYLIIYFLEIILLETNATDLSGNNVEVFVLN